MSVVTVSEPLVPAFRRLVAGRFGMHRLSQDDGQLLDLLRQRARALGLPSVDAYVSWLSGLVGAVADEWLHLARALTIGESYFFRDLGQMTLLRTVILPERLAANAASRRLRILSAGCSTGEEPYTLALLLDQLGISQSWDIHIIGADINDQALERARVGRYPEWSLRGVGATERERFFRRHGKEWEVDPRLRPWVSFRHVNLVSDPLPCSEIGLAEMDLILCRNVFIYFDADNTSRLVRKLTDTLRPGGYLLTGHAEVQGIDTAGLTRELHSHSMVYRRASGASPEVAAPPLASKAIPVKPAGHAHRMALASRSPKPPISPAPPSSPGLAELFSRGDYVQVIAQDSESSAALRLRARAYANLGQHDQAEALCRKLVERDSLDAEPLFLLAQVVLERGCDDEAQTLLNQALYLDSHFIAAHLHLAELHRRRGEPRRARALREAARRYLMTLPADTVPPMLDGHTADQLLRELADLLDQEGDGNG